MLSRMEDHLGVRLFERLRGGIQLTENGRTLYKISEGFNGRESAIREIGRARPVANWFCCRCLALSRFAARW
jgi:DNA-binding transcriptional LysR family regulator